MQEEGEYSGFFLHSPLFEGSGKGEAKVAGICHPLTIGVDQEQRDRDFFSKRS